MNWASQEGELVALSDGFLEAFDGDACDGNGLVGLMTGTESKTAAEVAEIIRSREGLLERLLGDASPKS